MAEWEYCLVLKETPLSNPCHLSSLARDNPFCSPQDSKQMGPFIEDALAYSTSFRPITCPQTLTGHTGSVSSWLPGSPNCRVRP